jgi:hypothetical protein
LIKIKNGQEKKNYFNEQIKKGGAYFNVKYTSGEKEFIWVKKFVNWNLDGTDWYLESPNKLIKHETDEESLKPYFDEEENEIYVPFEHCYVNENVAYEIDSMQTSPFLPEEFEIEFITDIENEAIKYMIKLEETV